jgi:fatty acid kinase fatty acid binding subunit
VLSLENTAIVLDSTADLPDPAARHPNWRMVPLYVRFGTETFRDYVDLDAEGFYRRLRSESEMPSTSQPTPADFSSMYESLEKYEQILVLTISAKLSGTHESARLAAESGGDERVRVIDSESASGGIVILGDALQRRLERGAEEGELDEVIVRFKQSSGLLFTVDTLDFLIRGGRVGRASGLAGQLLNVKPILAIRGGEVEPVKRVRGRAKALAEFERLFVEGSEESPNLHVGVAHAEAEREAGELVERIKQVRSSAELDFFGTLGPVVGTHAGPGTLGLFWFEDEPVS